MGKFTPLSGIGTGGLTVKSSKWILGMGLGLLLACPPLVTGNRKHFPPDEPLVLLASEFLANYFK